MIYIGVDPGKKGAMAFLGDEGAVLIFEYEKYTLPTFVNGLRGSDSECFAMLEEVGAMPGNGRTSMFSFGRAYGEMIGILSATSTPFELVRPTKWQKEFGLLRKKTRGGKPELKADKKNRHKVIASRLFPDIKITHANTDALLIAEYCRRQRTGTLKNPEAKEPK